VQVLALVLGEEIVGGRGKQDCSLGGGLVVDFAFDCEQGKDLESYWSGTSFVWVIPDVAEEAGNVQIPPRCVTLTENESVSEKLGVLDVGAVENELAKLVENQGGARQTQTVTEEREVEVGGHWAIEVVLAESPNDSVELSGVKLWKNLSQLGFLATLSCYC
jgi:hypothetical protein